MPFALHHTRLPLRSIMKLSATALNRFALFATMALLLSLGLAACGNSEDGPMLSDDEKLKRASQGRESYMNGMKGKAETPAPSGGTAGK